MLKKLLLASAVAAASSASFAMEAMDESALAETTGQDGLTINVDNANLALFDVLLHDKDGLGSTSTRSFDGAIKIDNIDVGQLDLTIEIDAGSDALTGTNNTLQVKVFNGTALTVDMGAVRVGNSQRDGTAPNNWGTSSESADLIDLGSLTIGATTTTAPLLNIQFGNEAQGAWMKLTPTFTGGLSIAGFKLKDGSVTTAGIGFGTLTVLDNGGANLTADLSINASAGGLDFTIVRLGANDGTAPDGMDLRMDTVRLGELDAATPAVAIGDVEIVGLNLAGTTLSVTGH